MFTFWNQVCLACQTKTPSVAMGASGMAMSLAAVPLAERQDLSLLCLWHNIQDHHRGVSCSDCNFEVQFPARG